MSIDNLDLQSILECTGNWKHLTKDPANPEVNLPNKIRLMWGRMENFKCVDYFRVEYFQRKNPAGTVQMTPRINRHRRSVEIEESQNTP